jgi:hypothetical protein
VRKRASTFSINECSLLPSIESYLNEVKDKRGMRRELCTLTIAHSSCFASSFARSLRVPCAGLPSGRQDIRLGTPCAAPSDPGDCVCVDSDLLPQWGQASKFPIAIDLCLDTATYALLPVPDGFVVVGFAVAPCTVIFDVQRSPPLAPHSRSGLAHRLTVAAFSMNASRSCLRYRTREPRRIGVRSPRFVYLSTLGTLTLSSFAAVTLSNSNCCSLLSMMTPRINRVAMLSIR